MCLCSRSYSGVLATKGTWIDSNVLTMRGLTEIMRVVILCTFIKKTDHSKFAL